MKENDGLSLALGKVMHLALGGVDISSHNHDKHRWRMPKGSMGASFRRRGAEAPFATRAGRHRVIDLDPKRWR